MAALGSPEALARKELLDRVAARLLPSEKARETMRTEWEAWCARRPATTRVTRSPGPDLKYWRPAPN